MNDPRNSIDAPSLSVDWSPPDPDETATVRKIIELHHMDRREYLRHIRGELIEIESDRFGCEITTDSTGDHKVITIECPDDV